MFSLREKAIIGANHRRDNWGTVDRWIVEDKITSHGQSGIGFVNFGVVNRLEVNAPIETFGNGARGFNVYTGRHRWASGDLA